MKFLVILSIPFLTACTDKNILVGRWEYASEKIISELRENPRTPAKILKCYENKACGYNTTFEYTESKWKQIMRFENGHGFESEYTDYEILSSTDNQLISTTIVDGSPLETIFTIIDRNNISYTAELDGFEWTEYLRRQD